MTGTDQQHSDLSNRLVALARDLILIPGTATRPEDRERCFEFVRNHLDYLNHIDVATYRHNDIPSLVARPQGLLGKKIEGGH